MREGVSRKGGELEEGAEMLLRKKHQQSTQNRDKGLKAKDGIELRGTKKSGKTKKTKSQYGLEFKRMEMRVGNRKRLWDSCHVRDSNSEERAQYLFYHLPTCQSVSQRQRPRFLLCNAVNAFCFAWSLF